MTDKEQFEQAATTFDEVKAFLDQQRCCNCEHMGATGQCMFFGPIDASYLYTVNPCEKWMMRLPF
jgi:hypothetical protein